MVVWLTRCVTVNVSEYVRDAADRRPDAVALVEHRAGRRELTWRGLDEESDSLARALSARGLVAGQRVAVAMANRVELVVSYFGILRGGMVAVLLDPQAPAADLGRMLGDTVARVVLCDDTAVDRVRAVAHGLDDVLVVVAGARTHRDEVAFDSFLTGAAVVPPAAPRDPETIAVILHPAGSRAGVMLSHRALVAGIEQLARLDPPLMTADDVVLGALPMHQAHGLNAVMGQAARQAATVRLVAGLGTDALLDVVADERITIVPVVPQVVAAWSRHHDLRARLGSARRILSGGLEPQLAEAFASSSGHVVEQGYGLDEALVVSTTWPSQRSGDVVPRPGTAGLPLSGVEVRIVEDGVEAAAGDPAEVWVRGANLFSGRWPHGADGPRSDGWYPTGDVGFVDVDGELTLVDRLRELVVVSGFHVYPSEVEEVVAEVPGVADVAAVGVPDELSGEAVAVFVVADDGADGLRERVAAHCRGRLARFKWPRVVIVVERLPTSATGEVARGRLRAMASGESSAQGSP